MNFSKLLSYHKQVVSSLMCHMQSEVEERIHPKQHGA
uniref:Uncharacterized protein n=1 Tax=Physcomitrium patens TaxID=3218 RepID=A0A2K1JEG2_PHYPA|nr:hypothetical protein PHYPA_020190 [Physcomitrium patens]